MRALSRARSVPNTGSCSQAFLRGSRLNSARGSAHRGAPAPRAVTGAGLFSWGLS